MSYSPYEPHQSSPFRNGASSNMSNVPSAGSYGNPGFNGARPLEHPPHRSPAYGGHGGSSGRSSDRDSRGYGRDRDRDRDMDREREGDRERDRERERDHYRDSGRGGYGSRGGGRYREEGFRGRGGPPSGRNEEQFIHERHQRERPSRTLFVRNIDFGCPDRELEERFSAFGPLRDFFSMLARRGIAFITYYDLRDAQRAKEEINGTMFAGREIDVHYSLPREDVTPETKCDGSKNQGTLFVVFEDQRTAERVSDDEFANYCRQFGDISNIDRLRGHPAQRFVEFFDSRACVEAQRAIDRSNYQGSTMVAQFSWDKATKEAIIAGGTHKDRNSRFRGGRSRSRSPPGRFRRDDAPSRGGGRRRSRSPPPSRGSRHADSPDRNRHSPPSRGVPSAEEVQRMLLASTSGHGPNAAPSAQFQMPPSAHNQLAGLTGLGTPLPGSAPAFAAYGNPALAAMHPAYAQAQPQQQQQQQQMPMAGINPQWYPLLGLGHQPQSDSTLQLQSLLSVLNNAHQQQASPMVSGPAAATSQAQAPPTSAAPQAQQNVAAAHLLSQVMQGMHSQQPSQHSSATASPALPTLAIPGMPQQPQQQQQPSNAGQNQVLQELLARYSMPQPSQPPPTQSQFQQQQPVNAPTQDRQQPQQQPSSSPPVDPRFRGLAPPKQ
ncbi:hypothetical protein BCR44DRAFT_54178 [Catenaria anguillulae PL171]|uniref:RRM domain-containing protein n=1 Tax=Catenaria anguillulae PL171 TaxID=765915 RepID=A0A1Y2HHI8_9FUNG|nr:hypothetical protein BCR44DRAFT_54178 [Catenaria anguillulae PL171]